MTSMPKPGSMVSILSQSSRVMRFTSRSGRPVPTRTACARLSTRWQIKSSRRAPRPLSLQSVAKLWSELADGARHGLGRPDGLGEGAADLDQGLGADRLDRLGEATGRLIKTPAELRAEAQRQRRARLRQHIAHAVKTEDMKIADHTGRQPQRCDRQRRDVARRVPRL